MIISASRRTDIPALYSEWLMNRLAAGFALVPNPFNPRQVQRVSLLAQDVDALVLWTKNPGPLLPLLEDIAARFPLLVHQTITAYPRCLEPGSPAWEDSVRLFRAVSGKIGRSRIIWRYDPLLFWEQLDESYHLRALERTAAALAGCTERLVVSFLRLYRKTVRNLSRALSPPIGAPQCAPKCAGASAPCGRSAFSSNRAGLPLDAPHGMSRTEFMARVVFVAQKHGLEVRTCALEEDFSALGALPGACVDADLLRRQGVAVAAVKDSGQRGACRCAPSRDIGMYDSCPQGCLYCYANQSPELAARNLAARHDPCGPSLLRPRPGRC